MGEEKRKFTKEEIEKLEELSGHKITDEELERLTDEDIANIEEILDDKEEINEKSDNVPSVSFIDIIKNAIGNLFKKGK